MAGKQNDRGQGFKTTDEWVDKQAYIRLTCKGHKIIDPETSEEQCIIHEHQVLAVPKPRHSYGKVVEGLRVIMVLPHPDCEYYPDRKRRTANVELGDIRSKDAGPWPNIHLVQ